jgi:hypothetical protein
VAIGGARVAGAWESKPRFYRGGQIWRRGGGGDGEGGEGNGSHLAADAVADAVVLLVAVVACLRHRGAQEGESAGRRQSRRIRRQQGDGGGRESPPTGPARGREGGMARRAVGRAESPRRSPRGGGSCLPPPLHGGWVLAGWRRVGRAWPWRCLGLLPFPVTGWYCCGGVITGRAQRKGGKTNVVAPPIIAVWVAGILLNPHHIHRPARSGGAVGL